MVSAIPDEGSSGSADRLVHADDLHPGDVVDYCGHLHLVTKVDRHEGWSWSVASDDDGWAIALSHEFVVLHRRIP